ncbi:MAG TPA: IclR family transcriptional regulator [Solirubrobacterales bacterium]|nr:IclR family transcriptional regulator [Solirubrobacterales bacterium]
MSKDGRRSPRQRVRIQVVERLGEVLQAFTPERPVWQLHELERHLDWDKATTYRFLRALEDIEILERYEDGSYGVGVLALQLAGTYAKHNPALGVLTQKIEEIADETGLTVQVGMLVGKEVVVTSSFEGGSSLRVVAIIGQRLPLHATALGKAVLAEVSDEERKQLLPSRLPALTPHTVTTQAELAKVVRAVREEEVAEAHSEHMEGVWAIAVGLPAGIVGHSPAAVACVGPPPAGEMSQWELAEERLRELRAGLLQQAKLLRGLAESPDAAGAPLEVS